MIEQEPAASFRCTRCGEVADVIRVARAGTIAKLGPPHGSGPLRTEEALLGAFRYSVTVEYQPMTVAKLAAFVAAEADFDARWRLVVEFLKEYRHEPTGERRRLLADVPRPTGDERWDVLFAGLAEHLAAVDHQDAPGWTTGRVLRRFWFPFDTPGARAQALVHAPAAFRRRGVFVADYELAS